MPRAKYGYEYTEDSVRHVVSAIEKSYEDQVLIQKRPRL